MIRSWARSQRRVCSKRRGRRLAHREDRRSLGRARAAAPGCAPSVRAFREGRRARAPDSLRLGTAVHRRCVDQRVKWLGMTITPSYVGEPECNGVIERFMRTLKEQCLYLHRFQTLADARRIIGEFIK